jgi:hypothetical protein
MLAWNVSGNCEEAATDEITFTITPIQDQPSLSVPGSGDLWEFTVGDGSGESQSITGTWDFSSPAPNEIRHVSITCG